MFVKTVHCINVNDRANERYKSRAHPGMNFMPVFFVQIRRRTQLKGVKAGSILRVLRSATQVFRKEIFQRWGKNSAKSKDVPRKKKKRKE